LSSLINHKETDYLLQGKKRKNVPIGLSNRVKKKYGLQFAGKRSIKVAEIFELELIGADVDIHCTAPSFSEGLQLGKDTW